MLNPNSNIPTQKQFIKEQNKFLNTLLQTDVKKKNFLISIIILISVIILILGIYFFIRYKINKPLSTKEEIKVFVIEDGDGIADIARKLKKEKLIGNDFCFKFYVWYSRKTKLQAGKYELSPHLNIPQIVDKLEKGNVISEEVDVTIQEGWTAEQIADYLAEVHSKYSIEKIENVKDNFKNKFLEEVKNTDKYNYEFLKDKPKNVSLEGYLFPDTYRFYKNFSPEDVINKMLTNFDKKLTKKMREDIISKDRTIFEIVTMASIVEKEVASDGDRAKVADIFYKRLDNNYFLESCATISYILGDSKKQYSFEDTRVKSPYNTYIHKGLTPGPIGNPGLSAIKAAIYPEETEYWFFLSDPKTGETIFSKTIEEHNVNKKKYLDKD